MSAYSFWGHVPGAVEIHTPMHGGRRPTRYRLTMLDTGACSVEQWVAKAEVDGGGGYWVELWHTRASRISAVRAYDAGFRWLMLWLQETPPGGPTWPQKTT